MKSFSILFLTLITLISVSGCKKEEKTGSLVVNARDGASNSLDGEEVFLYNNQADFNNRIYSKKQVADNSGQVKFFVFKLDWLSIFENIIFIFEIKYSNQ